MKKLILVLLLVLLSSITFAQRNFGGYLQTSFETVYTKPVGFSAGLRYKETRVGYFYQQAQIPHEGLWQRKGLLIEQGLFNVDKCAYMFVGLRVLTTNDDFVQVVPHAGCSFRYKHVEIPIYWSTYKGYATAAIAIRGLF